MKTKRLYREQKGKILAGVVAGLGTYFDVDPVILRLVLVGLTVVTGFFPGIIFYAIAVVIVPKKN